MKPRFWTPPKIVVGLLWPLVLLGALPAPASAYPRPGLTGRVSVTSGGAEGNAPSYYPSFSADGRHVAFESMASNLVPGDDNAAMDVFVHDRATGLTERVSVTSDGAEANSSSTAPAISADGRYVAFESPASNLAPGDANAASDVFVHDRATGTTDRISEVPGGADGSTESPFPPASTFPAISADGRHVAFQSYASNLVPGDTNGTVDVFVHDRATGTTDRISLAAGGADADSYSGSPALSADGRHVAFSALASNLVPGDTNAAQDIFVHDRATGTTERMSVTSGGAEANDRSLVPAISPDGRHVAFSSQASNLVPGDTNGAQDVFVHDRATGTTERISVTSGGAEANAYSLDAALSADGRQVAFSSFASNLEPGDANGSFDVFIHDRVTGSTERVSVASDGAEGNSSSQAPVLSPDGRHVAFWSYASNLVPGDSHGRDGSADVFVHDGGGSLGVVGTPSVLEVQGGVRVSGRATFAGAVISTVDDPTGDGGPEAASEDLTGASLTYRPEQEDLLVRFGVVALPGERCTGDICERGGGAPGVLAPGVVHRRPSYGMRFDLGDTLYEVRARAGSAFRSPAGAESDPPNFALYRCDPSCTEQVPLSGGIGTTGDEILVAVPLSALGASEGLALTRIRASVSREEGAVEPQETIDEADLPDAATPASRVELGIAPASTPEGQVAFTVEADLAAGEFSGTVPTEGLAPGSYRVWARACLGESCGPAAFGEAAV